MRLPDYYAANDGVVPFLLGIEEKIHEVVRATISGASPPKAARAAYYEERVELEEIQCMHGGDPGCVFTDTRV